MSNTGAQRWAGNAMAKPKDPALVMAPFDALPPVVRKALREAVFDWPADPFLARIGNGMSAEGAAAYVVAFEEKHLAAKAKEA